MMLEVKNVKICYDGMPAVHNVSFVVREGQVTSIVGSNGSGKTTLLKTIMGLLHPTTGEIIFNGRRIDRLPPHCIARMGISHVPEGRRLFNRLSVHENLMLGAYVVGERREIQKRLAWIYEIFPILEERREQRSGTLSGGEQQLLAIARGLISDPRLIMLDEPSFGVMPSFTNRIFRIIKRIREQGTTVLLVEQNVERSLSVADQAYVLQTGRIIMEGVGIDLLEQDLIREAYLGL